MSEDATTQSPPIFLSYARRASRERAVAVYEALKALGIEAFLDTEEIDTGDNFPERLVDALLGARVVVVFAEPEYFHRWYCLLEFRVARTPFLRALQGNAARREREAALTPLVIALPEPGTPLEDLDRLPAQLKATNWPLATEPGAVADLLEKRLKRTPRTLGAVLDSIAGTGGAAHFRDMLLDADRLPPPLQLNTLPAVRPPEASIHDLFVGRADDLWRIHDALTTHWGDVATAAGLTGALEGGGGFGKTRLAVEYFFRFGPRHYPGGLFWINAELDPEPQQYEIVRRLDPAAPAQLKDFRDAGGDVARRLDELLRALPADRPALVVVDNVPEPPAGEPPRRLESWVPAVGEVPLLVTSRTRVSAARPGAVVPLRVEVLDVDAAVALLTRGEVDLNALAADEWRRIAEWVGRLPLALELLNGLLAHGGTTPAALLRMTDGGSTTEALDAAMEALRGSVPAGALRGVSEALSESYRRLFPEAQAAARKLAFLAPEPVPEELVQAMGDLFPPDVRVALVDRSFVTRAPGGAVAMFGSMHRVLADFLRTTSENQRDELLTLGATVLEVFTPTKCRLPPQWSQMNALLPHADVVFESLSLDGRDEVGIRMALRLGWCRDIFADAQGLYARAKAVGEKAVKISQTVLGEEHPDTLTSMNNLAETYHTQGDLAGARGLQEKVVEVRRHVLGEEHPDTLMSMNNLAGTYSAQGDLAGAQGLQAKVVEVSRRVLGEEHPGTLSSMNNLAETYRDQGDLAGARGLQEKVVEVSRRVLGEEHPNTLTSISNLAETYRAQGDLAGAQGLQAKVLEVRRRVLGEEHPDTLASMNNLAETYRAQGDLAGAQGLQAKVLEVSQRVLGEEHPHTLTSMSNLAETYRAQGDLAGARGLQDKVLEARRRVLGEEHPDTLTSMNNLAGTYRDQGDLVGARGLQDKVLEVSRRLLGEEHPNTTVSAWNLLLTCLEAGDQKLAQEVFRVSLSWLFGQNPATLTADQKAIRERLLSMLQPPDPDESDL